LRRGILAKISHVHLSAELHGAKCQLAHDEAGVSEFAVLHFSFSLPDKALEKMLLPRRFSLPIP
jgi:hypothetical protein